jgi:uncharacterized protein
MDRGPASHPRGMAADRLASLAWPALEAQLEAQGYAHAARLLTPPECDALVRLYGDEGRFRNRVVMDRHRFGRGEYKYFGRPLPRLVQQLRAGLYPPLAAMANRWMRCLGAATRFPDGLRGFLGLCARAGQTQPTPLLLRYEAEGYNCLHQDVYGELAFPLQVVVMLSQPGRDHSGGEFLLVEQRPRSQSAGEAITAGQGDMLVFPNRVRPVRGARGFYRVNVRHGVSRVRSGCRLALGLIFHDARPSGPA